MRVLISGGTGFIGRPLARGGVRRGAARPAGEPVVIVCPAQAIAPGDHSPFGRLARLFVRRRLPPLTWAPEGAFTFAHVEDVGAAAVLAGTKGRPGETYFIAGSGG